MKKIIIIIPPSPDNKKISRFTDCSLESKASYLYQPIEMMIFTSHLDSKDEMVFIDGTADSLSENEFFKRVRGARGDILFFPFASMVWKSDYDYFQKVKQCLPDIPVFVIGDICLDKLYRSIILKECDGLIVNPYLIDLEKMMQVRNNSNSVKLPGVCTDDKEEVATSSKKPIHVKSRIPRHEMFSKPAYRHPFSKHFNYTTVMTVFGCPFSCSYCPTSNFAPVVRQPEDVLDELRHLKNLGIKELYIADHTFGYPREYSLSIVKEMAQSFNFSWSCFLAPQLYNAELLDMMHLAGCHTINIGIESLDSQSLRQQYQRTVGKDRIEEVIAHANRLGMSICADFILGLENEDKQDIIDSINYALSIPIDFVSFNVAAPLPGSVIRDKALNDSRLLSEREGLDTSGRNRVLGNTLVNNKTLKELQAMAIRKFYLRPSYLFRRLKKTTSWQHFLIQFLQMKELFLSKH